MSRQRAHYDESLTIPILQFALHPHLCILPRLLRHPRPVRFPNIFRWAFRTSNTSDISSGLQLSWLKRAPQALTHIRHAYTGPDITRILRFTKTFFSPSPHFPSLGVVDTRARKIIGHSRALDKNDEFIKGHTATSTAGKFSSRSRASAGPVIPIGNSGGTRGRGWATGVRSILPPLRVSFAADFRIRTKEGWDLRGMDGVFPSSPGGDELGRPSLLFHTVLGGSGDPSSSGPPAYRSPKTSALAHPFPASATMPMMGWMREVGRVKS